MQKVGDIAVHTDDIKKLGGGIKALYKTMAEATELRREEHEEYIELIASHSAVMEVLGFVKDRLNTFDNPRLYLPPPKCEISEEQRSELNLGGTLVPTNAPDGIASIGSY